MKWSITLAAVAALACVAPALAHPGPRTWINVDGGQIETYAGAYPPPITPPASIPSGYAKSRVFTQALVEEEGIWSNDFPGYERVPGGFAPANTTFAYDIAGELLWFDAAASSFETVAHHFLLAGSTPQFAVTNELFVSRFTGSGPVTGDPFLTYRAPGDHGHLTYTLIGDGVNAGGGPDGIYALPLEIRAAGLETSQVYYLLMGKNASVSELAAAADAANRILVAPQAVPEPTSAGLLAGASLLLLARRRGSGTRC